MPVHALQIGNFKGLASTETIPLKPLTLFIGPNSSGKSSCIHALAALAQTTKLGSDSRAVILDDEFAQVHLGRFIEVVHTGDYADAMTLGVELGEHSIRHYSGKTVTVEDGPACASYTFRSTKRTQDVYVSEATFTAGSSIFQLKGKRGAYELTKDGKHVAMCNREGGFAFGLLPPLSARTDLMSAQPFFQVQRLISDQLRRTLYLGPFRQPPLRRYQTRGSTPYEVGAQGESTITLLANEILQSRKRPHIQQIAHWLGVLGLGTGLDVSRVARSDLFDVNVTLKDGRAFSLADLGYGISQVLPVLAQCSFAPEGATLLFEQPELHLHQLASRPLLRVFIETIREKKAHIVAETHSPELVQQLLSELRGRRIALSDVAVYRVSRTGGRTHVKPIEIDPDDFDVYEVWEHGLSREFYGSDA